MRARCVPLLAAALLVWTPAVADQSSVPSRTAGDAAQRVDSTAERTSEQAPAAGVGTVESEQPIEEVIVTERRINLTAKEQQRIYDELATARRLYSRNQIDKAFPYLLNTAERGFKDSQAKVGHIYLQGLGEVERDSEQAVGWLGVASSGTTSPTIRNYFNGIWKRIPDRFVPHFEEVVDEYRARYGEQATGVVCEMYRPVRSYVKQLGCFFEEELPEEVREGIETYQSEQSLRLDMEEQARRMRQLMERQELFGEGRPP